MKQENNHPMMQQLQRGVLLCAGLLLAYVGAWAGPRNFREAQTIAERQAAMLGIQMSPQSMAKARMQYQAETNDAALSASSYYVFDNGDDNGFTIVSGDDQWPEIVGYSAHGNSQEALKAEGCAELLQAYQQMVEAVNRGDEQAKKLLAERNALDADASYQQPKVAPLLGNIAWDQTAPFNNMCPSYQEGKKCRTGCVATALAQVLMYYKYPKALMADIPAYVTSTLHINMPQIAKGETYDWENMLPDYSAGYTQPQADAVAKLMLHCGEAVKMDYNYNSGANISPQVLATYFGYDADLMQFLYRHSYTLEEWKKIIDREMEAKRPVIYGGISSTTGHQYVCDGTDGNGLYHINWGWGGTSDGYYDITILDPENRGAGAGPSSDGYNRACTMIIGIAPDNGVEDAPLVECKALSVVSSNYIIQKGERANAAEEFTVKLRADLGNLSSSDFKGLVSVGIKNENGAYAPIANRVSLNLKKMLEDGRYYYQRGDFTFDYAFPVGVTRLYVLYSTDNGATWEACATADDVKPCELEATKTTLTLSGNKLTAELVGAEKIYSEQNNPFELTVTNGSLHEYLGLVSIYVTDENEKPAFLEKQADVDAYVCIPVGGQVKRTISLKPSAGDIYVWIIDEDFHPIGEAHKFSVIQSEEAKLALVGKKVNATPDDYEKESAYYWNNTRVAMPKINADKAELTYSIRNDGGTYNASVLFTIFGFDGINTPYCFYGNQVQQVSLTGEGETTDVVLTLSPDDLNGAKSFRVMMSTDKDLDNSAIPEDKIDMIDIEYSYYPIVGTELVGYIAGASDTAIRQVSVRNGMQIATDAGVISVQSPEDKVVAVYQITGQLVAKVSVLAGVPTQINLRPGIYIVEGMKVVVK